MSKLRQDVALVAGDLETPAQGDLPSYVVFTQLTSSGPYIYAGWLDAVDDGMAIQFACEHYGQDQECVGVWAIPRNAIAGTEAQYAPGPDDGSTRPFEVFVQTKAGGLYKSVGSVEATGSESALDSARQSHGGGTVNSIWVVPRDRIAATREGDMIWRFTSQDYRMARGYSAAVREKWQTIRAERDLREYEKDDLREMF